MAIKISPITSADVPTLARLLSSAYRGNPFNESLFTTGITEEQREEFTIYREGFIRERTSQPNRFFFKAVEEGTDTIVGYSGWFGPEERDEAANVKPLGSNLVMPDFVDEESRKAKAEQTKAKRVQILRGRKDVWYLQALVVDPSHKGRGIASQLVSHGLEVLIDPEGRDCYLESSPDAVGVYRRHDFVAKDTIACLDGTYVTTMMIRSARKLIEISS